jgi:hypothetical protein
LKGKIEELETNSKINNIKDLYRGINDVKKGYQPRTGIVNDEKGHFAAESHSIMARWKKYFSQILVRLGRQKYTQSEGNRPLGRPRRRWKHNIKMDIQKVGGGRGDWMELAQDRDRWRALVGMVKDIRVS